MKNHLKSRTRVGEQQYYEIKLVFNENIILYGNLNGNFVNKFWEFKLKIVILL